MTGVGVLITDFQLRTRTTVLPNSRQSPERCSSATSEAMTGHLRRLHVLLDVLHVFMIGQSCLGNLFCAQHSTTKHIGNRDDVHICFFGFSRALYIVYHRMIYAKLVALEVSFWAVALFGDS